jgi:hypothetical protein
VIVESGVPVSAKLLSCALSCEGLDVMSPVTKCAAVQPNALGAPSTASTVTLPFARVSSDHQPVAGYAVAADPGLLGWISVTVSVQMSERESTACPSC